MLGVAQDIGRRYEGRIKKSLKSASSGKKKKKNPAETDEIISI